MGAVKIRRKVLTGEVVSDKMQKTIVVRVDRTFQYPVYKRVVMRSKRYKVHDEKGECKVGDKVKIIETRPLSKEKRWALLEIIKRAILR